MLGTRIAIAAVGLLALVALVRGLEGDDSREIVAELSTRVAALGDELAEEKRSRSLLEAEVGRLRAELDRPGAIAPAASLAASRVDAAPPAEPEPPDARREESGEAAEPATGFDPERLRAAGFSPSDVERYRSRVAEIALERLYLRDRATREGWLGAPRFASENRRLDEALAGLRGEFDENLYDWMLYAEGRPNRVAVSEVLPGSAAESAGLQPGDVILRYDDRLVLSPQELREATSAGTAGAWVPVEVRRADETVRTLVPRGPLGVGLESRTVEPEPAG